MVSHYAIGCRKPCVNQQNMKIFILWNAIAVLCGVQALRDVVLSLLDDILSLHNMVLTFLNEVLILLNMESSLFYDILILHYMVA